MMGDRTEAQVAAQTKLEEALQEWLVANAEANGESDPMIQVTGYVVKACGISLNDAPGLTQTFWAMADNANIFLSMGLADALASDVTGWYESGQGYVDHDEDDD